MNLLLLMISATLGSFVFSLENDLRTDSPSELSPRAIRIGRLVVRIGGEAEENNGTNVQDGLTEDSEGFQSDSTAGSYKAAESKLQRLNPSVHCGKDSMALRVQGNRVPNFMVDRGEGAVPVAKMPAHCGISMKRARRDLLLIAQYQGCDVKQQGDDYVLPLRLWGAPMSMSCPVASSTNVTNGQPTVPASDPQQPFGSIPHSHRHPFYHLHGHFWHRPTSAPTDTPAPTTVPSTAASTAPTVPASDPQQDWYPIGYFPYHHGHPFYPYRHFWHRPTSTPTEAPTPAQTPAPSTAASTAPTVPASDPQQDWYPIGYFPYHHGHPFYPYRHFWHRPTSTPTEAPTPAQTPAPSTAAATAPTVPASDPQQDWYPYHHRHPFYPYRYFWHGHTHAPTGAPAPAPSTEVPTPAPSTAASTASTVHASDPQQDWYPYHHRHPFYPYRYFWHGHASFPTGAPAPAPSSEVPTPAPSTAASTASTVHASDPQQDWYPYHHRHPFYPYRYFWPGHTSVPTEAPAPAPTTVASIASKVPASDPQHGYPFGTVRYHHKHPFYPFGHFWPSPTSAPSTGASAPADAVPASDSQQPVHPSLQVPYRKGLTPLMHYRHHARPGTSPCTKVPFWTRCY